MKLSDKGREIAEALAEDLTDAAKPPTIEITKDHYAYYADVIQKVGHTISPERPKIGHVVAAEALKIAGANKAGVDAAMWGFFGYSEYDPMSRLLGI